MEFHVALAVGGVILTGVVAAWWVRGRARSRSIDVGLVSGGWLIEHRCNTSDSASA
jgi:hypothetical protein